MARCTRRLGLWGWFCVLASGHGCGRVDYQIRQNDGGRDADLDVPDAGDAPDDAGADGGDLGDGGDGGPGGEVWPGSCETDHGLAGCAPMVWMEGGTFELGQIGAFNAEPVQAGEAAITVSGFYLDAYEVTVARFRA